jgi:hypothetical protein
MRVRHYSVRTEKAYIGWIRHFILFHHKRHPAARAPMILLTAYLGIFLAASFAAVEAHPRAKCPPEVEVRRTLGAEGKEWRATCEVEKGGDLLMAAVRAPASERQLPHLIVAVLGTSGLVRTEVDLQGPEEDEIRKIDAEEWGVSIRTEQVGRSRWIRAEAIGRAGEDLFSAQGVASLFALDGAQLRFQWTGLGDRAEAKFDACQLDTTTRFKLLPGGFLERTMRTRRTFADPDGTSSGLIKGLKKDCVAPPVRRDKFRVVGATK